MEVHAGISTLAGMKQMAQDLRRMLAEVYVRMRDVYTVIIAIDQML